MSVQIRTGHPIYRTIITSEVMPI